MPIIPRLYNKCNTYNSPQYYYQGLPHPCTRWHSYVKDLNVLAIGELCSQMAVHQDQEVYGRDADTFRPDRWLEGNENQRRQMDRSYLSFGTGKRTYMGVHIAWLEMKKTLPLLMMNFEVSDLFGDIVLG